MPPNSVCQKKKPLGQQQLAYTDREKKNGFSVLKNFRTGIPQNTARRALRRSSVSSEKTGFKPIVNAANKSDDALAPLSSHEVAALQKELETIKMHNVQLQKEVKMKEALLVELKKQESLRISSESDDIVQVLSSFFDQAEERADQVLERMERMIGIFEDLYKEFMEKEEKENEELNLSTVSECPHEMINKERLALKSSWYAGMKIDLSGAPPLATLKTVEKFQFVEVPVSLPVQKTPLLSDAGIYEQKISEVDLRKEKDTIMIEQQRNRRGSTASTVASELDYDPAGRRPSLMPPTLQTAVVLPRSSCTCGYPDPPIPCGAAECVHPLRLCQKEEEENS
uniref:Uncharacterized protein n=1 Tax=Chromera velia CCMP2878 TaxID=1169474 RepID=A0A0G4HE12_9ALVE|eukprot:Cvel_6431.t1-p1 / transcript=Cvel_6431.t1 / gene=Cvel_6431 / organism=Chromera_velia_CCMP2878 / gene_product=hypothetical protein / transcript_product=hypothetical protein / location=Cvel_scaffold315:861-2224(+) / protein_length=339 / sequence_SO=supercontig / SO=protein_coding / is_pseudo=false